MPTNDRIPSIPTTYQGVRYRSRLEARWAAMFDRMGWEHAYEPIDLAGYIPDFIVYRGCSLGNVLIECKPFITADASVVEHCNKIARSGWRQSALVLGAVVDGRGLAGRMFCDSEAPYIAARGTWSDCYLGWFPPIVPPTEPDDVTGYWDVEPARVNMPALRALELSMMWHEAGNITQWKPAE